MAKKESRFKNLKIVNTSLKTIDSLMNGIYKSTYNTDRNSKAAVDKISQDIEDSIANIISKNNMSDVSNVTKLLSRTKLQDMSNDKQFASQVNSIFEDQSLSTNILSMYTENRWIKDLDIEYDTVLRYMPRLKEALEAKKENVLSSDNFSKNFLNDTSRNINNPTDQTIFSSRMQALKEKYKLQPFYEDVYDNVSKYGEEFVYRVPYSRAISDLLRNKANTRMQGSRNLSGRLESTGVVEIPVIENGVIVKNKLYDKIDDICRDSKISLPDNFKVIFDTRGFLESAYNEQVKMEIYAESLPSSVYESVLEASMKKDFKFDETVPDELELPKNFDDKTSNDGLVSLNNSTHKVKTPGSVLKRLKHENVIMIYVDNVCLGYYYIEFLRGTSYDTLANNENINRNSSIGFTGVQSQPKNTSAEVTEDQKNRLLSYFAGTIAQSIDANFVNNNQDLSKEIYTILKYNDVFNSQSIDSIRISFLPENDVEHIFFKQDPDTHRGISDLYYALIPAKLYACLYITNTLGILTRGHDKRVYYVKQNVEQNIAQTMLNVINQIKRGNFGMREIENMNTILNITGRFNDYVIPVGPSGESPIQFEVMQGQDFNPNTELMDKLEEMAINSTDIPIEFIQNRMQSLDFAVQATTVNSKVLRSTYKRQSIYEYYLSRIQTKLYNSEYNENINITCTLPAPLFLHMTNINQMVENTKLYVQAIADYEYEAEAATDQNAEAKKAIFIRNMMRNKLTSYLKLDEIEEMKKMAELEYTKEKQPESN